MHFVASVARDGDRFIAICADAGVQGEGKTREEALHSLEKGLREANRPESVAPPSGPPDVAIELTVEEAPVEPPVRYGPGEA